MQDLNDIIARLNKELENATPEKLAEYKAHINSMPPDEQRAIKTIMRGKAVRELPVGFEGASYYYYCKYGRELPKHTVKWVKAIIKAHEEESGTLIEGFRGSTKSTIAITMCEYLLMKYPVGSGLIIAATETDANAIGKFMADTIASNAGWKVCAPNIVPDMERGWGAEGGYFIKDVSVPYEEWIQKTMKDHQRDPSFLATSVTSGSVGKHPSLFLLADDMHTGKNTSSASELKTVKARFFSDVFPTLNKPNTDEDSHRPCYIATFTPWNEEDTNMDMKRTGVYTYTKTPILRFHPDGDTEFEGEKCFLTWPEAFDIKKIEELRKMNTASEFARMYLCDLKRASEKVLTYYTYPSEKIDPTWNRAGGVDYASIQMPTRAVQGGRSHYALAIGTKTPVNTIVLVDGKVGQYTLVEGSEHIIDAQVRNIRWKGTAIEINGKGEEFLNYIRLNPNIRAIPRNVAGKGSKSERLYNLFDKILPNGVLLVSDADTPFLNTFRNFLDKFPNLDKSDKGWDVADSVYHMVSMFPECLAQRAFSADEPVRFFESKKKTLSPWAALG